MSALQPLRRSPLPLLITVLGLLGAQSADAQSRGRTTVPADTVVRLKMDTTLNSHDARKGQTFAAVLADEDRSGFPEGTRFQGVVREVQRRTSEKPGMLDVQIQSAYVPGGGKTAVSGRLASLDGDDVRRTKNGRLEARKRTGGKTDWKWAGYGAGAGAILSAVTGGKALKGAVLGGLGGAVYSYLSRDKGGKDTFRDVDLPRGTEFGMRLERQVSVTGRYTSR
jgi:hypothetical protein